jgi:hypothetical protein
MGQGFPAGPAGDDGVREPAFSAGSPGGPDRQQQTGEPVDPVLVDPATGERVDGPGYAVVTTAMENRA